MEGTHHRSRTSRRAFTTVVLLSITFMLLLSAAETGAQAAKDDMKRAAQLEKEGQYSNAAELYLRILRLRPGDQKARTGLAGVADRAIDEKVSAAAKLEEELRLDDAIAALESARNLKDRVVGFKIELERPHSLDEKKRQLIDARVTGLLLEAEAAASESLWSAAIAHLQKVESLKPDDGDTRERLYEVWVQWGEANIQQGRLRAAAERFESASRVPGFRGSPAVSKAARVHAELGLSALRRGACRAAVADLRTAERLAPGIVASGDAAEAEACARTCARVSITSDPDSAVGDRFFSELSAETKRRIAAGASEFLDIRTDSAARPQACGKRAFPGIDGGPVWSGPYVITVRVTALGIVRQPASSSTRQSVSQQTGWTGTVVTYEEYGEILLGSLSGWVTLKDESNGGVSMPLPIRVTGETTSRWRRSPIATTTARDVYGRERPTGVVVGVTGSGKSQADEARKEARERLTETLVQDFAAEVGRVVLSTLDVEPSVPDPTSLPESSDSR